MSTFTALMNGQKVLPLIQASSVEEGLAIGKAMEAAGLRLVEVVLRTPASLDVLSALKQECPDVTVGAGTVYNTEILTSALDAGADFIVSPSVTERLLSAMKESGVLCLPGVSKPSDIALALEHGFQELKLFPAELSGGVSFLKAMGAVFSSVRFCPTGGVGPANRKEYLSLSNVVAVGGSWVSPAKAVNEKDWKAIEQLCREANIA